MSWNRLAVLTVLMGAALLVFAAGAPATSYPNKPIRVIVPYATGGTGDILIRFLAAKLSENLGQQFIVDNRTGAGGTVGSAIAAKAPPDGYTLLVFANPSPISQHIYKDLPFDLLRDFVPISLVATKPNVLILHPGVPARTVKELIAYAKSKKESLTFGSTGHGTTAHLSGELFMDMAGVPLLHVPYKGSQMIDLIAGRIDMSFVGVPMAIPHITTGRVRPLAVTGARPSIILPGVPTIAETVPGYESEGWYGFAAPARTPTSIVAELNKRINGILNMPDVRERMLGMGAEPVGTSPEEFTVHLKSELARWGVIVARLGLTAD